MTSVVLEASAVLALVRDEPGADKVGLHVGRAAIPAVNLQEVVKKLLLAGLAATTIQELLHELRLDARVHDVEAASSAAGLSAQTKDLGRGFGDRPCLALAVQLSVSALTVDREWRR